MLKLYCDAFESIAMKAGIAATCSTERSHPLPPLGGTKDWTKE